MNKICNICVLKDNPDSEVLFALGSVLNIRAWNGDGFSWTEHAEKLRDYPISIPILHNLGNTALVARDFDKEKLTLASMCATLRFSGVCNVSEA